MQIILTCPHCSSDQFVRSQNGVISCEVCGTVSCFDEMIPVLKNCDEIVVPITDGFLVAGKGCDPEHPAIWMAYRTGNKECEIDLAIASTFKEDGGKDVTVYTYNNVYSDDYQDKFIIRKKDIDIATGSDVNV